MTRKSSHTSLLDECKFDPGCPFDCPLKTCVKEYPGGVNSYLKDKEFMDLVRSGVDVKEVGKRMGISHSSVERRYIHATGSADYQTKEIQSTRS